jgi:hypothetical protein
MFTSFFQMYVQLACYDTSQHLQHDLHVLIMCSCRLRNGHPCTPAAESWSSQQQGRQLAASHMHPRCCIDRAMYDFCTYICLLTLVLLIDWRIGWMQAHALVATACACSFGVCLHGAAAIMFVPYHRACHLYIYYVFHVDMLST